MKTMRFAFILVWAFTAVLFAKQGSQPIEQFSTFASLASGDYEGWLTCGELLTHGDFGIGTFDGLDGEMLVMDGKIYQIKADGKIYEPQHSLKVPFATVTFFQGGKKWSLKGPLDYPALQEKINQAIFDQKIMCAIKITGKFSKIKTRSVPAQKKPYPPLSEVIKTQPVFDLEKISGTLVGYRLPPEIKDVGVGGYHLHFVSDDRKRGGHVLEFQLENGEVSVGETNQFLLTLKDAQTP